MLDERGRAPRRLLDHVSGKEDDEDDNDQHNHADDDHHFNVFPPVLPGHPRGRLLERVRLRGSKEKPNETPAKEVQTPLVSRVEAFSVSTGGLMENVLQV